jgi:translation initiation factor eIF-2B subunit epsilon
MCACGCREAWSGPEAPFKITLVVSEAVHSIGDAVREIDGRGLVKTDFLLLQSGLVSNADLKEAIKEHRLGERELNK